MKHQLKLLALFVLVSTVLSGCSVQVAGSGGTATNSGSDGGVWRSDNKGTNWAQKSVVIVNGRPSSFGSLDGSILALDPTDNKTIYFGGVAGGLYITNDRGESWERSTALGNVTVNGIAVDPTFRCTVYAAVDNKVMKTVDCGRAWNQLYFDNDPALKINALTMDPRDGSIIYIGTTRGDVLKSSNRGESWQAIGRFKDKVAEVKISPFDSKIIMVANVKRGLQLSVDGGATWEVLDKNLKDLGGANNFRELTFSTTKAGQVYLATGYGILKSPDYGKTWDKLDLLTPDSNIIINSLAVNPKNELELFYVTNTTFYRSSDGGKNWNSKKLPSSRAGASVIIDPVQPNTLYLTVKTLKQN
ncbi:hypothetical protein HGA64_00095 [Candidatus Falkowbacteria bacterium]|nr:hypothetical protein [Candidatus Falkowbacteria bacterium]